MGEYHQSAPAVWDIKYHLVWITKYRYKVLRGEVAERARDLLREICAAREVRIIRGAVSRDHVQMLVVVPPQLAPAKLVQFLQGRSSRMLQRDFQHLRKRYWGQHLWARGYFCATVGAVDEKTVMAYIESQKPIVVQLGRPCRMINVVAYDLFVQWPPLVITKHKRST